jgi:chromosome segregation ATPase
MSNFEACLQGLQQIQQQAYALQSRIDASKKESESFLLQHKQKQRTMHTLHQEQVSLEAVLKQVDHTRYQTLTTQKQSLQATIDQLDTQRSPATFQVYDLSVQHLVDAQALINQRIEQ